MEKKEYNNIIKDNKTNKDNEEKYKRENHNLIPINISLVKNIFTLPQQKDKNIIYINDIETLNDSSITNNLEFSSIGNIKNDSLSLSQSNNSTKAKAKNIRVKNISPNNYIKNELIAKEKENILFKKEIFKLREEINLYQTKFLRFKQQEQNLEKSINDMKKEFIYKEKESYKLIEKLKNELKTKDFILNSFQEKIVLKNQEVDRLKIQLKKKDNQINELTRKLKLYLDTNNNNQNINKHNLNKSKQSSNSGRESTNKKIIPINSKEKIRNENKSPSNYLQLQHYHSNTKRESNQNLYYIEPPPNTQKVIGLKKRSKLKSPILFNIKSNNKKNENKNKIKIKYYSYSDKLSEKSKKENENDKSVINSNLKNLRHIFLLQGKNRDDVFLKRYSNSNSNINKNLKQNIKSSFGDITSSYMAPESEINRKNYKINIPKFKKRKNNSFNKINESNSHKKLLEQNIKIMKRKFNDMTQNLIKINNKLLVSNDLPKNNTFIQRHHTERKINFLYNNSINDSNSLSSNNNFTVNAINFYDNNSTKSNIVNKKYFNEK